MGTATARAAAKPYNVEGRPVAGRPSVFINSGEILNNPTIDEAQYLALVPRIIALHWLRAATAEAANG